MLYQFLKILVRIALKLFFKRIYIGGLEYVKNDRPQLIASNHPSGFLEPLIMACFFPKSLHFLVRGDVFEKKWLRPILVGTNQIPIFRFKDGFSKLRENSQNMDESIQVLLDNKNLLIFAEGSTQSIKMVRPIQKGIARIAFQALDKNPNLDLEILPIGINFTFSALFNDEVMLRIGPPIQAKDYYPQYLKDKNQAIESLVQDIYKALLQNVVHLADQTQFPAFEEMVLLPRKSHLISNPLPVYIQDESRLVAEIELAKKFNNLDASTGKSILNQIRMLKHGFSDKLKVSADILKQPLNIMRGLFFILGFIPAAIGYIVHALPIAGAHLFMKSKVQQREFKSTILFVMSILLIIIMYLLFIPILLICHWPLWIILLMIISGLWARFYHRVWSSTLFQHTKAAREYTEALDNIRQTYLPS